MTEFTNSVPIALTECDTYADQIAPNATKYYLFGLDANLVEANFEILNPTENVDLFIRRDLPVPSPTSFFYASTNLGTASEMIVVTNGGSGYPLAAGPWYLAVVNQTNVPVNFTVRVAQFREGRNLFTLANGVPFDFSGNCPAVGTTYFRYNVSSSAVRAQFEALSPSEDVNLVVHKGLPLPTVANSPYRSSNGALSDELITVFNNSTPPLTPGDWYIGVIRSTTNGSVTYTVKATEFSSAGTNLLITSYAISPASLCIVWTNALPGAHYFVQGKVSLSDSNWVAVSPTLTATDNGGNYCVALPTTTQFFRVAQGLSPASITPGSGSGPPFALTLAKTSAAANLNWTGPASQKFRVQWSPSISPPAWKSFTNDVSSTNGNFSFRDDGSKSGGLGPMRFYRIMPITPTP